ncbi:MAG: peptidylprolyl isomerase [Bacteroidota bacterium]|nr:peptidylprolyl isomerase [Bacteroidota bacterium]
MVKRYLIIIMALGVMWTSCKHKVYPPDCVKIETNFGDIIVQLFPDKAPATVANFLKYVDAGYYKNGSFYRVLKAEDEPSAGFKSDLIQGGIWQTKSKLQAGLPGITLETTKETGILHRDGTISMARSGPNTATTEFFIVIGDQKDYDYGGDANTDGQGFAAFGRVVDGMDIVRDIHSQPDYNTSFTPPIAIKNIVRVK